MKLVLSTTDPTAIPFAQMLLQGQDITSFALDVHMSALEGGMPMLPRRLMVAPRDFDAALQVLRDHDFPAGDLAQGDDGA
jgi:hypothetical protein